MTILDETGFNPCHRYMKRVTIAAVSTKKKTQSSSVNDNAKRHNVDVLNMIKARCLHNAGCNWILVIPPLKLKQ